MNLIVIHGDYVAASYSRLDELIKDAKKRGWEIKKISANNRLRFSEQLSTKSLFEKDSLYIFDQLTKLPEKELKWLNNNEKNLNINFVLYHTNFIPAKILRLLPKHKVEEFKLPRLIWNFLDSFYPGNSKKCLYLLHKVCENEPVEFVLALLSRRLKDLYIAKIDPKDLDYAAWRVSKLKTQSKRFTKEQLKEVISALASADVEAKQSKLPLLTSLDLIITSKLE